jgi:hypothetical protein
MMTSHEPGDIDAALAEYQQRLYPKIGPPVWAMGPSPEVMFDGEGLTTLLHTPGTHFYQKWVLYTFDGRDTPATEAVLCEECGQETDQEPQSSHPATMWMSIPHIEALHHWRAWAEDWLATHSPGSHVRCNGKAWEKHRTHCEDARDPAYDGECSTQDQARCDLIVLLCGEDIHHTNYADRVPFPLHEAARRLQGWDVFTIQGRHGVPTLGIQACDEMDIIDDNEAIRRCRRHYSLLNTVGDLLHPETGKILQPGDLRFPLPTEESLS